MEDFDRGLLVEHVGTGAVDENLQERIQRYGGYLAAMVLPNIAAILKLRGSEIE